MFFDEDVSQSSNNENIKESERKNSTGLKPLTFRDCVLRVNEIYEKSTNVLEDKDKYKFIQQTIRRYFDDEDSEDVFEGFLNLVIHLDKITTLLAKQYDLSLVITALNAYNDFLIGKPELTQKAQNIEDVDLLTNALKIVSVLKVKHLQLIVKTFHLNDVSMTFAASNMINELLLAEDFVKAIQWMSLLNLRDHYPFEQIVCRLLLLENDESLKLFVGEAEYRHKKLLKKLDELVGLHMRHRNGVDEYENRLIADHKRIVKLAIKYAKKYKTPDSDIANVMIQRAYDALLYNHFCWKDGKHSWVHFEELALPPLSQSEFIREKYFNFLLDKGLGDKALYFAHLLKLPESQYPRRLAYFMETIQPNEIDSIRDSITKNLEIRKRNQEIEQEFDCSLDDGTPIILVDSLESLDDVIEVLRNGGEKLLGIDAEWRPHYLAADEKISLIQIATSKVVYIIDVLRLEVELELTEDEWINFFDALFCTPNVKKIGYDFINDIRVLKSTFSFMSKLFLKSNNIICLYKLFGQIALDPEFSEAVFGGKPLKNLGLSDVANYFLGIQVEKSERTGNWSQRPLRLEQKKYAALDAHCLVQLYKKIAPLILKLREDQQNSLQNCALIKFINEEEKKQQNYVLDDGQVVKIREGENDFFKNIQMASHELNDEATNSSNGPLKSINDVRFVVDSMLFGLGKVLRKCGFDTRLIGDRKKIVEFCQMENNKDFIVLSTGKGHKQLETLLNPERVFFVPISTTRGATKPSQLVNHIMHELRILIRPEDLWSRCVECNKRAFVPVPMQIIQLLFYMNAVRIGADWLEISEEDLQDCFQKLKLESQQTIRITPEMHSGKHPRKDRSLLGNKNYFVYEDNCFVICETRTCTIDIINKLILSNESGGPTSIHVGLKYKKETFEDVDLEFFVCAECGKVQFNNPASED
uniref:3'-5' exonuclease domain-containing protein n=1 Tax=Meloidogyne incognita TaxID=6306 RepID=A0A914LFT2_MELIC